MFEAIAGGADRLVVIDTETTGLYNSDRVVEFALITLALDGQVIDVWDSLIQPERDVGPTHIHQITASMVANAPTFADVAGDIAVRLEGACLVAHNLPFDLRMTNGEFERLGERLEVTAGVDTLRASGCALGAACAEHGIELDNAHRALADATATAELLRQLAARCDQGAPATAPLSLPRSGVVLRRQDAEPVALDEPPLVIYLASRLNFAGIEVGSLAYLDVLGRAVSDLHLDRRERDELAGLAQSLGMTPAQTSQAHRRFVNQLVDSALDDHVVTDDEYDTLRRVAAALEVDAGVVERRTRDLRTNTRSVVLEAGTPVVFTGEADVPRSELVDHASRLGLEQQKNVTKRTGLLVAADPASESGKAGKARQYGVPILSASEFIDSNLGDALEATVIDSVKVVTCPECLANWTVPGSSPAQTSRRCDDCG
ncbi:MAG: exonuclease domain-containing protein [Acidimicrobiales bacterium]|nr:exonuclease domain-containing protein [Acidimicrobiales bacterium]